MGGRGQLGGDGVGVAGEHHQLRRLLGQWQIAGRVQLGEFLFGGPALPGQDRWFRAGAARHGDTHSQIMKDPVLPNAGAP